ncbi:hypothetical protein niasHT_028294 [Heterodera trifolii]|uniref:Integrase catalytic domain-containing protein n=1 Tax=Heterodera trifolii TaxID=157864 RepID=A0ABD2K5Y3_9BILA
MRPRRVHFPRAKTVAAGFMTDVQVDLADFQALSRHNRGHRYLLVAVDVLSKRLFVVPLKNKRAEEMLEAFKQLIDQMPMVPHRIFSDKGTEFKNRLLKEFFEEQEIEKHEPVHSSVKASVAERAIRNVKQRLYRYFAEMETLNWVDAVQKIVDGINNAPSRIHGMRPIDVDFSNAQKVWKRMYHRQPPLIRQGAILRRDICPNYGDEILEIDEVLKAVRPIRYKLRDEHGEKFKGSFYEQELARVRKDAETSYRIEKVYRKRKLSDGNVTDYPDNQPNKFRVRLPKPLHFNGTWVCGLHSISYPYSWSTIGTLDAQWIDIHFFDRHAFDEDRQRVIRVPVPKASHSRVEQLRDFLAVTLLNRSGAKLLPTPREVEANRNRTKLLDSPPPLKREKRDVSSPPVFDATNTVVKTPAAPAVTTPAPSASAKPATQSTLTKQAPQSPKPATKSTTAAPVKATTAPPPTVKTTTAPPPTVKTTTATPPTLKATIPPPPTVKATTAHPPTVKAPTAPPPPKTTTPVVKSPSVKPTISAPPAQLKSTAKAPSPASVSAELAPRAPLADSPPRFDEGEEENKTDKLTAAKPSAKTTITAPPAQLKSSAPPQQQKQQVSVKPLAPISVPAKPSGSPPRFGKTGQQQQAPPPPTSAALTLADLPENTLSVQIDPLSYVPNSVSIQYLENMERFKLVFNEAIVSHVSFSPQLGYVLGFENPQHVMSNELSKYPVDLRGGISSFAVYSKGLTENMIIGNSLSSLLRVVSISGAIHNEYNEKIYDSPIFARVLPREINEIEIELRTMDKGRLVPFAYGTTMVVLIFKKVINF